MSNPKHELKIEYLKPSPIQSEVLGNQKIRETPADYVEEIVEYSPYAADDKVQIDGETYAPVLTTKIEESTFTSNKSDMKLHEPNENGGPVLVNPVYSEIFSEVPESQPLRIPVVCNEGGNLKISQIPVKSPSRDEKIKEDRPPSSENKDPIPKPRQSSIPVKTDKTVAKNNNSTVNHDITAVKPVSDPLKVEEVNVDRKVNVVDHLVPRQKEKVIIAEENDVNDLIEKEFDKIFKENSDDQRSEILDEKVEELIDNTNDPELVETTFDEIVQEYDDNKVPPFIMGKIKTKIPLFKQKSLHDLQLPKTFDRRFSLNDNNNDEVETKQPVQVSNEIERKVIKENINPAPKIEEPNANLGEKLLTEEIDKPIKSLKERIKETSPVLDDAPPNHQTDEKSKGNKVTVGNKNKEMPDSSFLVKNIMNHMNKQDKEPTNIHEGSLKEQHDSLVINDNNNNTANETAKIVDSPKKIDDKGLDTKNKSVWSKIAVFNRFKPSDTVAPTSNSVKDKLPLKNKADGKDPVKVIDEVVNEKTKPVDKGTGVKVIETNYVLVQNDEQTIEKEITKNKTENQFNFLEMPLKNKEPQDDADSKLEVKEAVNEPINTDGTDDVQDEIPKRKSLQSKIAIFKRLEQKPGPAVNKFKRPLPASKVPPKEGGHTLDKKVEVLKPSKTPSDQNTYNVAGTNNDNELDTSDLIIQEINDTHKDNVQKDEVNPKLDVKENVLKKEDISEPVNTIDSAENSDEKAKRKSVQSKIAIFSRFEKQSGPAVNKFKKPNPIKKLAPVDKKVKALENSETLNVTDEVTQKVIDNIVIVNNNDTELVTPEFNIQKENTHTPLEKLDQDTNIEGHSNTDKNETVDELEKDENSDEVPLGIVNKILNRLHSKDSVVKKDIDIEIDELPKKRSVSSRIALFERQSSNPPQSPKLFDVHKPRIVDHVSKVDSVTVTPTESKHMDANKADISCDIDETQGRTIHDENDIDDNVFVKDIPSDIISEKERDRKPSDISSKERHILERIRSIQENKRRRKSGTDVGGEKIKGRVNEMVYKIKSMENLNVNPETKIDKIQINIKERPRQRSVFEKIALFENKVAQVQPHKLDQKKVWSTPRPEPKTHTTISQQEIETKIRELMDAKTKYGTIAVRNMTLNDGNAMPILALGTALLHPDLVKPIVKTAIDLGYRAIDTAFIYGNEQLVGEAIKEKIQDGTVTRDDLFIISKLWSTFHRTDLAIEACKNSLDAMQLDYFDLYLVHNPMSFQEGGDAIPKIANVIQYSAHDYMDAWRGLEDLVGKGLVTSIGVSNFNVSQVVRVVEKGRIKPAINQVECHPYLTQARLDQACDLHEIKLSCFGILGSKGTPAELRTGATPVIDDPLVHVMAAGLGVTPGQLLIKYQIARGHSAVVKASSASRLWENLQALEGGLTPAQIGGLDALNKYKRTYAFKGMGETHKNYPFNSLY